MANIMFVGDVHGKLNQMYRLAADHAATSGTLVDLIVQAGDFEAIRTPQEVRNIVGPRRFRQLGDFHEYHDGTRTAPIPTWFIGGNHENYDFLDQSHPKGIEVAPHIQYLGRSGVAKFGGLAIGFLSGIYDHDHADVYEQKRQFSAKEGQTHSNRTRPNTVLFNKDDVEQLTGTDIDILVTHDIPGQIQDQPRTPIDDLVEDLSPQYHYAGHVHRYAQGQIGRTHSTILNEVGEPDSYRVLDVSFFDELQRAAALLKRDRFVDAIRAAERTKENFPTFEAYTGGDAPDYYMGVGKYLQATADKSSIDLRLVGESIEALERASKLNPVYAHTHYYLAFAYSVAALNEGNATIQRAFRRKALDHFQQVEELSEDYDPNGLANNQITREIVRSLLSQSAHHDN